MSRPDRHFSYLAEFSPPAHEALLLPLEAGGVPVGTIWAVSHDEGRRFDAEDLRLLKSLGAVGSVACRYWPQRGPYTGDAEEQLEEELAATRLVHSLSVELVDEEDFQQVLERITDAAAEILHSEYTTMQMFHPPGTLDSDIEAQLELLTCRGLDRKAQRFWKWVRLEGSRILPPGRGLFGAEHTAPIS